MAASPPRTRRRRASWPVHVALVVVALLALSGCSEDATAPELPDLTSAQRVYDATGDSLSVEQIRAVTEQLTALQRDTDANAVVLVRELDADPADTLEQVEALQQAWVAATGAEEDTAVAILINREPGTDDEARAGVFVGSTFDDGNVPSGEQQAIVDEALVPPLRDGDVAGSLSAGIERLGTSIRRGPPTTAFDDFAAGPGSGWLVWVGLVPLLLGSGAFVLVHARRPRPTIPELPPTVHRPDQQTEPWLAGALVGGAPSPATASAAVLELAARDALVVERETRAGWLSKGSIRLRLLEESAVRPGVEREVWDQLAARGKPDPPSRSRRRPTLPGLVVSSADLREVATDTTAVRAVVEAELAERGWLDPGRRSAVRALWVLTALALLVAGAGLLVATARGPVMLVTVLPAAALAAVAFLAAINRSTLSVAGREAARPWEAYRDALSAAGEDESVTLDLDAVLVDVIAMNLAEAFEERLGAAATGMSRSALRAFTAPDGYAGPRSAVLFPWSSFSGSLAVPGSDSGAGMSSSGGDGGGGGASGST